MLILVRTGETRLEAQGAMPGARQDVMTANGAQQVKDAQELLQGQRWDYRYCGPSEARVCAGRMLDEQAVLVEALAERRGGNVEGMAMEDIRAFLPPKRYKLWERDYFRNPPGGESLKDVEDRVRAWVEQVIWPMVEANKRALIVAQETPLRVLIGILRQAEPEEIIRLRIEPAIPYFWHGSRPL